MFFARNKSNTFIDTNPKRQTDTHTTKTHHRDPDELKAISGSTFELGTDENRQKQKNIKRSHRE